MKNVTQSLDWDIKSSNDINRMILQVNEDFDKYTKMLYETSRFIFMVYTEYDNLDKEKEEEKENNIKTKKNSTIGINGDKTRRLVPERYEYQKFAPFYVLKSPKIKSFSILNNLAKYIIRM